MKKIKTSHDMNLPGWGIVPKGTPFKVVRFNKRFVYVELKPHVELRLNRKSDCEIMY